MLRARITFFLGLLLTGLSIAGLVVANSPHLLIGSNGSDPFNQPGELKFEFAPKFRACAPKISRVEFFSQKWLYDRIVVIKFERTSNARECNTVVLHHNRPLALDNRHFAEFRKDTCLVSTKISQSAAATGSDEFASIFDMTRRVSERATSGGLENSNTTACSMTLWFKVPPLAVDLATHRFVLQQVGGITPENRFLDIIFAPAGDELSIRQATFVSFAPRVVVSLSSANMKSWLVIFNIILSTIVGVGISAMFEATLALTTVSAVRDEIARLK